MFSAPPQISAPFAHLNLRWNPFGEPDLEERGDLAIVEIDSLALQLQKDRVAIQFLGDKGRGKTTHLLKLHSAFRQAPYIHIAEDEPTPAIPRASILFIDECQRLSRLRRARVFGIVDHLALASHIDHSKQLRRAGLRPITVQVGESLNVDRVEAIVSRRIEWARRGPGYVPTVSRRVVEQLVERYGSDMRAAEDHLYDVFQRLTELCDVEM